MTTFRVGTSLLAVLFSGLGSSCAVTPPSEINAKYAAVLQQRHDHYELKSGDSISITLYNLDGDLDQVKNLILSDGRTDLFHMHDIRIAGKTVAEFEAEVKEHLAEEFRNQVPDVKIQVIPSREFVYVHGEFERPVGQLALAPKMTLQEAISVAGGSRVTADTDWALLRRPYLDPRHPDLFRIDLNDESEALFLLPGDQIVLGRTFLASVAQYLHAYIFSIFTPALSSGAYAAAAF